MLSPRDGVLGFCPVLQPPRPKSCWYFGPTSPLPPETTRQRGPSVRLLPGIAWGIYGPASPRVLQPGLSLWLAMPAGLGDTAQPVLCVPGHGQDSVSCPAMLLHPAAPGACLGPLDGQHLPFLPNHGFYFKPSFQPVLPWDSLARACLWCPRISLLLVPIPHRHPQPTPKHFHLFLRARLRETGP